MKNFTKLLMAVVLLATYSCVQDSTEDLAPVVSGSVNGSGEVKTLQVALPVPTRTELGEKADGKYPVFWSEGDVLAVNGKPTTNIAINEGNRSVAVFDLPLGSTIPYHIVYPYPGEDVAVNSGSGLYPVVFAVNQLHTEGTFAQGAAPMYTWSDGFTDIQMHHLSTVLRFPIKAVAGSTVDLKYVSVSTVGAEPVAGVFDVYCGSNDENDAKTGTIAARESATSTVFYNFENDSYTVDENGAVFYIVVPYGSYSGFEVNFVANNGQVCVRTFKGSEEYALVAGKVREFPEVEFSADSNMYLIGNDVEMLAFAEMVKNGTFSATYSGALLTADVDVTDKGLTTIEGYALPFEGRHYTIKGLAAPLFGENVEAQILNLNVEGQIVEESNPTVGLIARSLAVGGRVFNCSVTGSIEYKNPNITVNANHDLVNVGGAVGTVYGAEVSVVKSNVDVLISVAGPDGDALYNPCFGGVVGYACASGETQPVVSECTSNGSIVWADESNNEKVTPFIGGVAGYVSAGTFADNTNTGNLEINEKMFDLDWGGVIGAASVSVERCVNKGSMTINHEVTTANIGGVIGKLESNTNADVKNQLLDCENSGKVMLNENFKIVTKANIGGVAAVVEANTALVSGCNNSGSITYLGECSTYAQTKESGNTVLHLGGVVGICSSAEVANCANKATAVIDVRGSLSGNAASGVAEQVTGIGGVIGARLGAGTTTKDCQNDGNVSTAYTYCGKGIVAASGCIGVVDSERIENCNNAGKVYVETTLALESKAPTPTSSHNAIYVSAIAGFVKSACDIVQCDNSGRVEFDKGDVRTIYISAINSFCQNKINVENCSNSGDVVVGENAFCWYVYAGGVLATTKYIEEFGGTFPYINNKGNVTVKCRVNKIARVGGIFGDSNKSLKTTDQIPGVQNMGAVTFSGTTETLHLGGYAGIYTESNHPVQFVNANSGVITFDGRATIEARIGGYVGTAEVTGVGCDFDAVNRGNIYVKGFSPLLYVGGAAGYATLSVNGAVSGLKNEGVVEIPDFGETLEFPTTAHLGGVAGYASFSAPTSAGESTDEPTRCLAECTNEGEVRYHALVTDGAYIGGIVGKSVKTPIYKCTNNGKIVSTGNAGDLVSRQFESKDKALMSKQLHDHDLAIGGVVGETDANVLASANTATIEHTCNPNPLKIDQWGEMASSRFDIGGVVGRTYVAEAASATYAITLAGLTNEETGKITIYGSPECTKQTSSLDWTSDSTQEAQSADIDDPDRTNLRPFYRMNLSGVVGRIHDHSAKDIKHFLTNCQNRAEVIVPDAPYAKMVNMAGVLGDVLSTYTTLTSCSNSGNIKIDNTGIGTSLSTAVRYSSFYINMAGIVANCFDCRVRSAEYKSSLIKKTLTFNQCRNTGNIYYGENRASFNQCAGGMLAQALNIVTGRTGTSSWSTASLQIPYTNLTIDMNQCENHGDITFYSKAVSVITSYNGTSFAGGMVGNCGQANNSMNHQSRYASITLNIAGCKNYGDIQFERSNGSMSPNTSVNYSAVGGLVGYYFGSVGVSDPNLMQYNGNITVDTAHNLLITSGENHGRVWGFAGYIGGIVGRANWYAKITGTEAAPTINTGDIVVARNESAGGAVRRTGYGTKVIYAGGIAGALWEQYTDTRFMGKNTGTNEGWPAYTLGSHYCRVEHAINKGAVGATSIAGGIVGDYRCFYAPTKELAPSRPNKGGIENCTNLGDIYALEGATSQVGAIVGSYRTMTITEYSSYTTDETKAVAEKTWPVGVFNCKIGGTILRGANRYTTADAENYMNVIYGENWNSDEFTSLVSGKGNEYDGCKLYTTESEDGGDEEPMAVRR